MFRPIEDQEKVSLLIAAVLLLILGSTIGFGGVVISKMTRLESNFQEAYVHSLAVTSAGLEAHTALSKLHNQMLVILLSDRQIAEQQDKNLLALDKNLRKYFSILQSEFQGSPATIVEVERLLDEWQSMRMQLLGQIRYGQGDKALKLATSGGVSIYRQLESSLSEVVGSAQHHADDLVKEAKIKSTEIIHFVWWFLGGFILSSIVLGWVVILKVGKILELSRQTAKQLLESEERMQLALSGADEGTWDLDISTGKLSFDSKWGGILGYSSDSVRPSNLEDWAALIHGEDRDRVLKAMGDHIGCSSFEYKEEYRIRSKSGALKWVSGHGRAVSRDSAGKALRIVGVTRDITMKKQAEEKIWQLAHSDYLTGLPNRAMFYDRLQQCMSHAKRHKKKLAIFFMDLDDFKQVNDNFGHDVGDLLLQEVAVRLRRIIRAEDTVARTGGDEFLFILNDVARIEDAGTLAEKIIQSVADPFLIQGNSCMIGSSIGISFFPDDSDDMDTLVTQSDEAMYKAKERGKNNYQFYSPNSR